MKSIGSVTNCLNDADLLGPCLDLLDVDVRVVVISDHSYQGNRVEHDNSEQVALDHGAIVLRVKTNEQTHMRNMGIALLRGMGIEIALIVDTDEWFTKRALDNFKKLIEDNDAPAYRIKMKHVFRYIDWGVDTLHDGGTVMALKTSENLTVSRKRDYDGPSILMAPDLGDVYHLSYARSPESVLFKIKNFSHASEVVPNWYEEKFLPARIGMTNVHPTVPEVFPVIFQVQMPEEIAKITPKYLWSQQ